MTRVVLKGVVFIAAAAGLFFAAAAMLAAGARVGLLPPDGLGDKGGDYALLIVAGCLVGAGWITNRVGNHS